MYNFLIADDHDVVILGVVAMVSGIYPSATFTTVKDGEELTNAFNKDDFDMVVMDVNMPRCNSLGTLEWILTKKPQQKVVIFSMSPEQVFAKRYLKAGAKAFISKLSQRSAIIKAFEYVMNGKVYLSDDMMAMFATDLQSNRSANPFQDLSPRELEIMALLINGFSVTEISKSVSLQRSTIGTYKKRIFLKTGVKHLLELASLARLNGVDI
jgi:two-component system, NarL family, invasion response regulator UvrY